MSSSTAPSTSTNNLSFVLLIFCAGLFSVALQTVFLREFLSVFSGNELSIGLILCVWLLAVGAGTAISSRATGSNFGVWFTRRGAVLALVLCAAVGIVAIRASRLVFLPGAAVGPLQMLAVIAAGELPFAFANGLLLGALLSRAARPQSLYGWENAGAAAGALAVFGCVLAGASNGLITVVSAIPLALMTLRRPWIVCACGAVLALVAATDGPTVRWKYAVPLKRIIYGREGEIVSVVSGSDTTFLLNGALYKSTLQKPSLEQAVHIPMCQRSDAQRVLVVFDRGQKRELEKYSGCSVDIVETEPAFAAKGARVAAVEALHPAPPYDMVFLGTGIPLTAAENRFYTTSFFARVKALLADSGIVTFTLPFSENYFSPAEKKLYGSLRATLGSVFPHVLVFPGEGYTFMASSGPLSTHWNIRVGTEYLAQSIIPATSDERIAEANRTPVSGLVNSIAKPVALFLGLQGWLEQFGGQFRVLASLLCLCLLAALWFSPHGRAALSVGTSGLVLGAYSACVLLLYQATYGALYSRVSLLLVALTLGLAAGALVKKLPLSDFLLGLYCGGTLLLLSAAPPTPLFFYLFHAGAGALAGAQMVTRKHEALGGLYAADVFGGAIGMAVSSTLLVPLVGIVPVAAGMVGIKAVVEIVNLKRK
jgi:spermidine synthase